jgi:hypothetical protein
MLGHGDDKPVWFTEFGWSTTSQPGWGVSAQQQADYTKLAYQCMQQDSYVQVAVLYILRNNYWANDADDWEDQLGLVTTNWSHKPAYDAFKSVDPNQGGCTYHDGSGNPVSASGSPPPPPPATPPPAANTGTTTTTPVKHRVTVHVRRSHRLSAAAKSRHPKRRSLIVVGSVAAAHDGRVQLRFECKAPHGQWRRSLSLRVAVGTNGRFKRSLATRRLGRWRVRAVYVSAPLPAASHFAYFRL